MNFLADGESDTSCINSLKSLTPILLLRLVLLIFVGSKSFSFSISSLIYFIGSLVLTRSLPIESSISCSIKSIIPIVSPILTSSCSLNKISFKTPLLSAYNSCVTLSVSSSTIGSPFFTFSPADFIHLLINASEIDSPRDGTMILFCSLLTLEFLTSFSSIFCSSIFFSSILTIVSPIFTSSPS